MYWDHSVTPSAKMSRAGYLSRRLASCISASFIHSFTWPCCLPVGRQNRDSKKRKGEDLWGHGKHMELSVVVMLLILDTWLYYSSIDVDLIQLYYS